MSKHSNIIQRKKCQTSFSAQMQAIVELLGGCSQIIEGIYPPRFWHPWLLLWATEQWRNILEVIFYLASLLTGQGLEGPVLVVIYANSQVKNEKGITKLPFLKNNRPALFCGDMNRGQRFLMHCKANVVPNRKKVVELALIMVKSNLLMCQIPFKVVEYLKALA